MILGSYVYIPVSDLQRAAAWYSEHLGFRVVHEDAIFLELRTESGVRIMLIPNAEAVTSHMKYPSGPQAAYGFVVADIDRIHDQLVHKGITVRGVSNYAGKSFGFCDPDGNVIELWSDYPNQ